MNKFFVGAKNLNGQVIVAEIIEAENFHAALMELEYRAAEITGLGQYRVTAVNEHIAVGILRSEVRNQTAEFLEGAAR